MMSVSIKLPLWWLACFATTMVIYVIIGTSGYVLFDAIQVFNIMVSLFFSSASLRKPFSLMGTIFLFCFFFFGVIPLNDVVAGNVYWGGYPIDVSTAIITSLMISACLLIFIFNLWFFGRQVRNQTETFAPHPYPTMLRGSAVEYSINHFMFLLIFVGACAYIYASSNFNIFQVMVRGLVDPDLVSSNSSPELGNTAGLIYNNFLKPIPIIMFIFLVYCSRFKGVQVSSVYFIFYGALVLIFNSPFSMPRYQAGALYLALALIYFDLFFRPFIFGGIFIFALLFVFPFLDKFRNFDSENFEFGLSMVFLNEGHFDSYNNFVLVVQHSIVTGGTQLASAILFFVPRSLWPQKAIGSGGFMADQVGLAFSNISMPFLAEGYINFGFAGVVLFAFVVSALFVKVDNMFWYSSNPHFLRPVYYLLIGMVFFMMRGDFMSSYAYSVAMVGCYVAVYKLLYLRKAPR